MSNHTILFYRGDISALTLFCQWPDGHVCFPPLPKLAEVLETDDQVPQTVMTHPAALIKQINATLKLDNDLLVAEPGYYEQVDTAQGIACVYMARFALLDPPTSLMKERRCKLQPLTGLIGRAPAEMELLHRAYVHLMES